MTREFREDIIADVKRDFAARVEARRPYETQWRLNMNFYMGNQYCTALPTGEIADVERDYYWQEREVFNHISAIVETRQAKLNTVRPSLTVRPFSSDDGDVKTAKNATKILNSACDRLDVDALLTDGTMWSEICGTAFYKIMWDGGAGAPVGTSADGKKLSQGDVKISAVPPFEIYPFSLSEEKLSAQPGIIHACAVPVSDIYAAYGVKLAGKDAAEFAFSPYAQGVTAVKNGGGYELVIERYERPAEGMPEGRFTAVAGGKLLYDGPLPYKNGENGTRDYPFVKQTSLPLAGSFFGASVVDRLIPVQRAYNAVKNRKHEFLNRFALGMLAVEDGSVDADGLEEDGLTPGKVIVYRQGARPPEMMQTGTVPAEFGAEEENLLAEFAKISGTGSLSDNADGFAGITSATGLQLIIDQDETRLDYTYRQIKRAIQRIGRHILRLYRQFASDVRLLKTVGESSAQSLLYFKGSDISSDDVVLEADSESNLSPAQRRAAVYEMLDRGLFSDENGRLSPSAKNRVLELLGYKGLSGGVDLAELNRARAGEENAVMRVREAEVKSYDDHAAHIAEHTAYLLTEKTEKEVEARICAHIEAHRRLLKEVEKDG